MLRAAALRASAGKRRSERSDELFPLAWGTLAQAPASAVAPGRGRSTPLPAGASWRRFPSEENTSVRSDSTLSPLQGMHKS